MLDHVESHEKQSTVSPDLSGILAESQIKGNQLKEPVPGAVSDCGLPQLALCNQHDTKELLNGLANQKALVPISEKVSADPQNRSYLQTVINAGTSRIISNEETRNTVNRLSADFVKTASLFTGGKLGMAGTFIAYGLDQARPSDSWKEQAADFALGGTKGETMRGMFSVIGSSGAIAPLKGALLGLSSGAADEVFKRQTFTDPDSLNDRLRRNAFNPQAVLMNAAVFTAGEGLYAGLDYAAKGALSENRMLSGMVMGGSFGFVNGSVGEASRELRSKGTIDPGKVLLHGLLEGGVSAAGAGVGMKISDPVFQARVKEGALSALESIGLSSAKSSQPASIAAVEAFSAKKDGYPSEPDPENPRRPDEPGGPYNEPGSDRGGPDGGGRRGGDEPGGPFNEPDSGGGPFMGIIGKQKISTLVGKSDAASHSKSGYPYEPDPENPRRPDEPGGPYNEPGSDRGGPDGGGRRGGDEPGGPFMEPGDGGGPFMGIIGRQKISTLVGKSDVAAAHSRKSGYPYEPDPENPRRPDEPGGPYNEPGSDRGGPDGGGSRGGDEPGGPFMEPGNGGGPFMGIIGRLQK